MARAVWLRVRPDLVIEVTGGASLGNCYSSTTRRVTSASRLTREQLTALYRLGLLGMGQEFYIRSTCDGTEEPAVFDDVPCVMVDDNDQPTGEPAINQYTGEPRPPTRYDYFVYDLDTRCDSGD